jgi:hypothetical protein
MMLKLRLVPHALSGADSGFYELRIILEHRGREYQKASINKLPEIDSMMDYMFEAAKAEMKAMIRSFMQTGSPVDRPIYGSGRTPWVEGRDPS